MSLEKLNEYSDELLTGASVQTSTPAESVERLEELAHSMRPLIEPSWQEGTPYLEDGLRAATVIACLPSLRTVALSEPHTQATANEVSEALSTLSKQIITADALKLPVIKKQGDPEGLRRANGKMSEIAVLGLFWWGIAHGRWDEGTYALPATTNQDSGKRDLWKEGKSHAADIILRKSDSTYMRYVQVKTSAKNARLRRYHPEVIVVPVSKLMDTNAGHKSRRLLRLLATGSSRLEIVHDRLDARVHTAEEELAYYERYHETN